MQFHGTIWFGGKRLFGVSCSLLLGQFEWNNYTPNDSNSSCCYCHAFTSSLRQPQRRRQRPQAVLLIIPIQPKSRCSGVRRRQQQSALLSMRTTADIQNSMVVKNCKNIATKLFPPIPHQRETKEYYSVSSSSSSSYWDDTKDGSNDANTDTCTSSVTTTQQEQKFLITWKDNFINPQYIANELGIGAKYMAQRMFILYLAAILSKNVWSLPATAKGVAQFSGNALDISSSIPLNGFRISLTLDSLINICFQKQGVHHHQSRSIISGCVKPICEELFYRGMEYPVTYFGTWLFFVSFAWVCGKSWWYGLCVLMTQVFGMAQTVGRAFHTRIALSNNETVKLPLVVCCLQIASFVIPELIKMVVTIPLVQTARQTQQQRTSIHDKTKSSFALSSSEKRIRNTKTKGNRIINLVSPIITEIEDRDAGDDEGSSINDNDASLLSRRITTTLRLSSRYMSSLLFGIAHLGNPLPLQQQYILLQKCFGTFASSFLIESRLFIQRRTVWCPIGAHIMFNSVGVLTTVLDCFFGIRSTFVIVAIFYIFLGTLFIQSLFTATAASATTTITT